ncbi:hypothetical protein BBI15_10120 [Planococcus plakortidis]|uniref:Uncharacterized protein n=1 Tax=Planococcus plakortidis TaxID=1038856 RepID=A0A1C7EA12_9BACL|nr:hypothetical protein [Planococcus plakortidis]ANU20546.1 hypothetical protein BBI15_10120 [Planococcus plakortidis]
MREYRIGLILSAVVFILLLSVNTQFYHNVMPLSAPITLLTLHVMIYRYLIPEKRYGVYFFFVLMVGVSIIFSLPKYTHQQAQEQILVTYGLDMELTIQENLPLDRNEAWNPFAPNWGYAFLGTVPSVEEEHTSLLFIPDTGRIFEITP